MHILVEGFDGTGKSTLCRMLSLGLGWPAIHQAQYRPESRKDFEAMCSKALEASMRGDLISDRWPQTTHYCYELERYCDLESVISSLRDARVDRIIHCDVNSTDDLRIEARAGDARDLEQTARVREIAPRVLAAYRGLMYQLSCRGFEVRVYKMANMIGAPWRE